jgi:hypothetical protein
LIWAVTSIAWLGQDVPKVLVAVDQQLVEALAPRRSRISLREGVRPG